MVPPWAIFAPSMLFLAFAAMSWSLNSTLPAGASWLHILNHAYKDPEKTALYIAKRLWCPLLLYLLMIPLLWFVANVSVYPGNYFDLPSEGITSYEATNVFSFTSQGNELLGYRQILEASRRRRVGVPIGPRIPFIFLGGNGGSGPANVKWNTWLVEDVLERASISSSSSNSDSYAFDMYSFSYRGYWPNDDKKLGHCTETNIIEDSMSFTAHIVQATGKRPLVMGHSLGTGAAVAVAEKMAMDTLGPACLALFCPFTTMRQVALEKTLYSTLGWEYVVDSWRSLDRIRNVREDMPLAVISALEDTLIRPHLHKEMYKDASTWISRKKLIQANGVTHNNIRGMLMHNQVPYADFLDQCLNETNRI